MSRSNLARRLFTPAPAPAPERPTLRLVDDSVDFDAECAARATNARVRDLAGFTLCAAVGAVITPVVWLGVPLLANLHPIFGV